MLGVEEQSLSVDPLERCGTEEDGDVRGLDLAGQRAQPLRHEALADDGLGAVLEAGHQSVVSGSRPGLRDLRRGEAVEGAALRHPHLAGQAGHEVWDEVVARSLSDREEGEPGGHGGGGGRWSRPRKV